MLVTKKYHQAVVKQLEDKLLFSGELTKAVKEVSEQRINELKAQIEDLRKLVFPAPSSEVVSKTTQEFDAVISASEKPVEMSEEERTKMLEGIREMDLIISGNYDTELGNV